MDVTVTSAAQPRALSSRDVLHGETSLNTFRRPCGLNGGQSNWPKLNGSLGKQFRRSYTTSLMHYIPVRRSTLIFSPKHQRNSRSVTPQ